MTDGPARGRGDRIEATARNRGSTTGGIVRTDTRAVSTALGYVLVLGITAILVSGLLVAAGGFVEDQRDRVVRSELEVVGQQVASGVSAADRLVAAGDSDTRLNARLRLPERVADRQYSVRIVADGSGYEVLLRVENPDETVRVGFVASTPVATGTTVRGGVLFVSYDASAGQLELRRAR